MKPKFYVTTPIYYINDVPSIGHAYTTIAADVLARFHRLKGDDVFFLTGLDENSEKTVQAAKKLGASDVKKYADDMAFKWKTVWKTLDVRYDGFIRTTEERHKKVVDEFFGKVMKKGDVYKGKYEGLYCEGCEAFVTENDLADGKCPLHKKAPKRIVEENYFFKLSKYEKQLLEYINANPGFIQPETRRNEVVSFIKQGLKDVSISRPGSDWGIPLPIDGKQRFWVWFDALLNYVSGGEGNWPADLQLMAKDIIKFHCIIWPAMLFSAESELPKKIFAHGFLTVNGLKMSKSLGNAVDPIYLSKKYSVDALRYFLLREISFGEDGDFSERALETRFNNELADIYGNFVYRVLSFVYSKFDAVIPAPEARAPGDKEFEEKLGAFAGGVAKEFEEVRLKNALEKIMEFAGECNKYFNDRAPWKLAREHPGEAKTVLFLSARAALALALALSPIAPSSSEKVFAQLGVKPSRWGDYSQLEGGARIAKPEIVFKKIEDEKR